MSDYPLGRPAPRAKGKLMGSLPWRAGVLPALIAGAELAWTPNMGIHLNGKDSARYLREAARQLARKPRWELVSEYETLPGLLPHFCLSLYEAGVGPEANNQSDACSRVLNAVSSHAQAGGWTLRRPCIRQVSRRVPNAGNTNWCPGSTLRNRSQPLCC